MPENQRSAMPWLSAKRKWPTFWNASEVFAARAQGALASATAFGRSLALSLLALLLIVIPAACRTTLSTRRDAGQGADAATRDAPPDQTQEDRALPDLPREDAVPPDLAYKDLAAPDLPFNDLAVADLSAPDQSASDVVLDITWLPTGDAGIPQDSVYGDAKPSIDPTTDAQLLFDSAPADRASASDPRSDLLPAAFADLAGRTFQIAASDSLPDASLAGRACGYDRAAVYDLIFSADGTAVRIVRMDPVQEATLDGTAYQQSESSLVYNLTPTFAGGQLSIRREGSAFFAQLVIFGSGVPVIWCIDAPMTPV